MKKFLFVVSCAMMLASCTSTSEKQREQEFDESLLSAGRALNTYYECASEWHTPDNWSDCLEKIDSLNKTGIADKISSARCDLFTALNNLQNPPKSRMECYEDFLAHIKPRVLLSSCYATAYKKNPILYFYDYSGQGEPMACNDYRDSLVISCQMNAFKYYKWNKAEAIWEKLKKELPRDFETKYPHYFIKDSNGILSYKDSLSSKVQQ